MNKNSDVQHDVSKIIAELDERGYCVVPTVITPEKADEARTVLERLLAEEATEGTWRERTQRVARIAVKDPIFVELMTHPLILSLWREYLDEDMICSTWTSNTAYPGFNRYGWHPDFPFQRVNQPWPTDNVSGQTMWLLDDLTVENGGTGILPYSHLKGHRPPADIGHQWIEEAEILTGQRGSVMVMNGRTWHSARPNVTDKARSVLLGMYTRPFYVTQEDMRAQLADLENPSELVQQVMGANQWQPGVVGNRY